MMIFVTGPQFAGKRACIRQLLGLSEETFAACAVWDVQEMADSERLDEIADFLCKKRL